MFLKETKRFKNGKDHHYWSLVENRRVDAGRKVVQRHVLPQTLVSYRLIDPGSEWRLHREWFDKSAMADVLGGDYRLAIDDTLYRQAHHFFFDLFTKSTADAQAALYRNPLVAPDRQPVLRC